MRIGNNPQKSISIKPSKYYHQLIIPVYIPNSEGFYKDAFKVFKICLESVLKTTHDATFISIVNNGSSIEVSEYLHVLYESNKINELIHTTNIGKINAINKAIVGQDFPIITISDADVLFENNWQQEVYRILMAMPKVGAICTTPISRNIKYSTQNIYFDLFFSSQLKFDKVKNPEAMKLFLQSVDNEKFFRPIHFEKYLMIKKDGVEVVVGAGHYVCTYTRKAIENIDFNTTAKLLGKSIMDKLDSLVIKNGFWRVSTSENYTYHMGNLSEQWMYDKLDKLEDLNESIDEPNLKNSKQNKFSIWIKVNAFGVILFSSISLWKKFLVFKGLTKKEAKQY